MAQHSPKLKEVMTRVEYLLTQRTEWEPHWRDLAEYIVPNKGRFYSSGERGGANQTRGTRIIDATATRSVRILAAGMHGGLTAPSRPWFRLRLQDADLMEFGPVRRWLDVVESEIYAALARANFYQSMHGQYTELAVFGCGDVMHEADDVTGMRFTVLTCGEYAWAVNARGRVDTVAWITKRPVREVAYRYGEEALSKNAKKLLKDTPYAFIEIVHFAFPREDAPMKLGAGQLPYACIVYEKGEGARDILYEGGYEEFPHLCARWEAAGADVYGTGPGKETLPDVKMLQEMAKSQLLAVHKVVNPPMRVPTGYKQRLNLIPGAQNYVNPNQPDALAPLYQINPDIQAVTHKIEDVRRAIREGFFNDLFMMFAGDTRSNVTAAEIMERSQEKLIMLGPVIERFQTEILDPLVARSYGILARAGRLPPPPPELNGVDVETEFISVLAQAQKLAQAQSTRGFVADVINLAQTDPTVLHKVDLMQAVDELHSASGAPASILRADDEVEELLRQQAEQQQREAQMQQLAAGVEAAKGLAQAPMGEGNALEQLVESAGGGMM